ncbi:MAG: acylphosphatase [Anaerolineae bacterium]|nr:acylphosphatase [Anaerolineae bacterium]
MSVQKRLEATVHGYVQGVGFRYWVREQARWLNLSGYVRNLPDRTVEVVAEGNDQDLAALLSLLHDGPPTASVKKVDTTWRSSSGSFRGFEVRF